MLREVIKDDPSPYVKYIEYIEQQVGCTVDYISVGAEREQIIIR